MAGRKFWTRQMMIYALKREYVQTGEIPRVSNFRKATHDQPSYLTIAREFGSWEAALREAGMPQGSGKRGRRRATVTTT